MDSGTAGDFGHDGGMATRPPSRSVKISEDERTGWSSDRPRRDGAPPRPADLTVHCRVLAPADRLRYSPGSLLIVASASAEERDRFLNRLIEDRACLLSLDKVRALLAGRVAEEDIQARAADLLQAAVAKRLESRETVVIAADGLGPQEREPFVRMAAALKRPRHLIMLEIAREKVQEEDLADLNELRRALDAGELGAEGFQTALRLGGGTAEEVKRILSPAAARRLLAAPARGARTIAVQAYSSARIRPIREACMARPQPFSRGRRPDRRAAMRGATRAARRS